MASLDLFLHDLRVGSISPVARDRTRVALTVDRDYDAAVLLSEAFAPLAGRRSPVDAVTNFLGGYVPEGNHRERMAAKRRIDKDDLFALLREFGGSIAGAVTLRAPDEDPRYRPEYDALDDRALAAKLKQALDDSDQGIPDDSRSTLPGYQPKVLVAQFDSGWLEPHGRAHSTHILKPQVASRPNRIFDEHYSHLLTQRLGLSTYASEIRTAGRMTYLAIERFDRTVEDGAVRLHHQEDLAQALGLDWRDTDVKFQSPDWPADPKRATARRIGELLGSIPGGDAAIERWIEQLTYTVAIGDNDAHAKNVALMHEPSGTELAQIYDALPSLFQQDRVHWDLALAIDGQFDHRRVSAERILAEVRSWDVISERRAASIVGRVIADLQLAIGDVTPPAGVSPGMVERLHWSVDRLAAGDEISEPKRKTQMP
ncbi:type II toxin-antitoxin system HipA family toxin [Agrococcus sp. KRD186]|jgi:serine/threonine-protein kinase HipA|uniref:type II toxin-antitoxin system HipA family toxin n=1 Tax=Agrococcus sp. KRD186 TaxID=2729730 RepID=UPI0019CF8274|nr:HipA domain-containing protein [Agrococcus sp. KRD186]